MWPFTSSSSWKDIVDVKQEARRAALEASTEPLESYSVYLKASASEIVEEISAGRWTATEVLEAYIARAALAHGKTNCITEVLFEQAREEATKLDVYFQETKQLKGPLHGVPVSFKDVYNIRGYDTTMGHTGYANQPVTSDADVVHLIRQAGGIPFVKTNLSQCMMFFECVNPTWGRTLNPHNRDYSSGGSTGGEGALIAMDGSPLGWGSDIGGSLRIPASYCGIYSFKPGFGRISTIGCKGSLPGFEAVRTVCGPLARSVSDLEIACRVTFGQQGLDYDPAPIPYQEVKLPQKLRFGYYATDTFVKASPACQRAVLETVAALRREGHECIEFVVPEPNKPIDHFIQLTSADGNKTLFEPIGYDDQQFELATVRLGPLLPGWIRRFASWVIETVVGDSAYANILRGARTKSVDEFWKVTEDIREYSRTFNHEVWDKYGFDGIIAPVLPVPALPHTSVAYVASMCATTLLYNIVESPVGTIPVTKVDPERDDLPADWLDGKDYTKDSSSVLDYLLYNKNWPAIYDAHKMAGIPVGVQLVGKRWEEEKVIEMMKVVDRALGKRPFGPGSWHTAKM